MNAILTLTLGALAVAIGGGAVVYSGVNDVGADTPHSAPVHAVLEMARERSIAVRAAEVEVPELGTTELIRSGAGNYAAMCVGCHLAPGVPPNELSQGLYPAPPNLAEATDEFDPAATFWVIKHGLKSTGMAAWGRFMEDHYIWGLVAFIEQLPSLTPQEYQALVDTSGGHQHGGGESDMHGTSGHEGNTHHAPADPSATPAEAGESDAHHHPDSSEHAH